MTYLFLKKKYKHFIFFLLGILFVTSFMTIVNKKFSLWNQVNDYFNINNQKSVKLNYVQESIEKKTNSNTDIISYKFYSNKNINTELFTIQYLSAVFDDIRKMYMEYLQPYPHLPRLILVYPLIEISNLIECDRNVLFTYFCYFLISIFSLLAARINCLLERSENKFEYYYFGTLTLFTLTSLFMNGRLIYSFTGAACLLYGQVQWILKKKNLSLYFFTFIGIILSNVSGGTFLVIFTSYLLFMALCHGFLNPTGAGLIIFLPISCIYILKNFFYFNDIWMLLSHGYGKFITMIYEYNQVLGIFFLSSFVILAGFLLYFTKIMSKRYPKFSPFLIYAYTAIILGILGWSTFAMSLCVCLILAPYKVLQWYNYKLIRQ